MPGLIGPDGFREVAEVALGLGGVDGVEVLLVHEFGGLTRFASSAIHQSTSKEDTDIRVRVVSKDRAGVATTNDLSAAGALRAAENAREMAQIVMPDPLFPGLAPPAPVPEPACYDEATSSVTPEQRAEAVALMVGACGDGLSAAGAYETTTAEVALANTEGQFCWSPSSRASASASAVGGGGDEGGSGFAEAHGTSAPALDFESLGRRAAAKARESRNARDLEPGRYEVVLEPPAVSTLVDFLAYMGFGGRALIEERSCLSGKEGQRVAATGITIYDDALSPLTLGVPFDFEGTPHRRVDLIREGVFVGGVHDRRSARQAETESTGHGLPPPNPEGPFPLNLFLEPKEASVEEMIAATGRGLLVTRFHYSNIVNPVESSITGMTRDGTFLIEDGEVRYPVRNLRFTQSILDALSATSMVGRDTELATEFFFSSARVPPLKIDDFGFTGRSNH